MNSYDTIYDVKVCMEHDCSDGNCLRIFFLVNIRNCLLIS